MYWFDEESKTLRYWYPEEDEAIQALDHLEIAEDWKDAEHRWDDVCEREIKEALWWANECSEATGSSYTNSQTSCMRKSSACEQSTDCRETGCNALIVVRRGLVASPDIRKQTVRVTIY